MTEIWKPIPSFDGYEVSNQGNVRSYRRSGGGSFHKIPHSLKPSANQGGYLGVSLRQDGETHRKMIATLVMLVFIGPRPDGMQVCHNNSISTDNQLENLRYDTPRGKHRNRLDLSNTHVVEMRKRRATGESIRSLAKLFDMNYARVQDICNGRSYIHIGGPFTSGRWGNLTIAEVVSIRTKYAAGDVTMRVLGNEYGLSESAISRICRGEQYKNDPGPLYAGANT